MWARESFWSHSQLSRRSSQRDRALGWNTAILRSSEERKLNIRKCLFPPNGVFRRRSRTELRSVDTNLSVKHRRQQRRFRRRFIDTRRWCRLGSAMLSLDLPPLFRVRYYADRGADHGADAAPSALPARSSAEPVHIG